MALRQRQSNSSACPARPCEIRSHPALELDLLLSSPSIIVLQPFYLPAIPGTHQKFFHLQALHLLCCFLCLFIAPILIQISVQTSLPWRGLPQPPPLQSNGPIPALSPLNLLYLFFHRLSKRTAEIHLKQTSKHRVTKAPSLYPLQRLPKFQAHPSLTRWAPQQPS